MYDWTKQQKTIYSTVAATINDKPLHPLVKINAVAGSSKTTVLVEIAKRFKHSNPTGTFRYLVFGNANATEAKQRFGSNAECSTLHSLAYQAVVKPYKLKLPLVNFISWKNTLPKLRPKYQYFVQTTELINNFCNSNSLSFEGYLDELDLDPLEPFAVSAKAILTAMYNGQMQATHSFYLKLYHMGIMSGHIKPHPVDILATDEIGDLTPITIDIIEQYPATQKIIVGDQKQAIFKFMGCINGFDYFKHMGITLPLTQSFRVPQAIAESIETFCKNYIDPHMIFKGTPRLIAPDNSAAIITRTNSQLIDEMIKLNLKNRPYKLVSTTKINQIFKYPLFLAYAKPGTTQYDPELKALQEDINIWSTIQDSLHKPSLMKFLLAENKENEQLKTAAKLIIKYGNNTIIETHKQANEHVGIDCNLTLSTAHSVKGLEFSNVYISDDLNHSIEPIITAYEDNSSYVPTDEEYTELLLYYVAVSRCTFKLINAKWLI